MSSRLLEPAKLSALLLQICSSFSLLIVVSNAAQLNIRRRPLGNKLHYVGQWQSFQLNCRKEEIWILIS